MVLNCGDREALLPHTSTTEFLLNAGAMTVDACIRPITGVPGSPTRLDCPELMVLVPVPTDGLLWVATCGNSPGGDVSLPKTLTPSGSSIDM